MTTKRISSIVVLPALKGFLHQCRVTALKGFLQGVILLLLIAPSLKADFEELGWSAASGGMADAAMFSKKIPSLFYINPAASSYFEEPVIGMEYENMYSKFSNPKNGRKPDSDPQ